MHISAGATRTVLVTRRFAIKFPRFYRKGQAFEWKRILYGLIANLQERYWSKFGYLQLCPVLFSDPVGLVVVMPRCEQLGYDSEPVMSPEEFEKFRSVDNDGSGVPIENVRCNFGHLNGKLVSFDYGT